MTAQPTTNYVPPGTGSANPPEPPVISHSKSQPADPILQADAFRFPHPKPRSQAFDLAGLETKDPAYPQLHPFCTPTRKLGGDVADFTYRQAWIDGAHEYRITRPARHRTLAEYHRAGSTARADPRHGLAFAARTLRRHTRIQRLRASDPHRRCRELRTHRRRCAAGLQLVTDHTGISKAVHPRGLSTTGTKRRRPCRSSAWHDRTPSGAHRRPGHHRDGLGGQSSSPA